MAFKPHDLSVLSYANGFTLWHFTTEDNVITGTDYFNAAADMLRVGDVIIANVDTNGTLATELYAVTDITSGAVTIALVS